jgi:hypothetical protein
MTTLSFVFMNEYSNKYQPLYTQAVEDATKADKACYQEKSVLAIASKLLRKHVDICYSRQNEYTCNDVMAVIQQMEKDLKPYSETCALLSQVAKKSLEQLSVFNEKVHNLHAKHLGR